MDSNSFIYDNFPVIANLEPRELQTLKKLHETYKNKQIYQFKSLLENDKKDDIWVIFRIFAYIFSLLRRLCCFILHPKRKNGSIKEYKAAKELLFEREGDHKMNFFEKILKTPGKGNGQFISLVWVCCDLWRDVDILTQTNSMGKLPIDYIIESNFDDNLFCFLIFDINVKCTRTTNNKHKYYMKLKNYQYIKQSGRSIFNKIYRIVNLDNLNKCLIILEELLKEVKEIDDIKLKADIDLALKLKSIEIQEKVLKLLVKYWKIDSRDYQYYRKVLVGVSPYFHLYLSLREDREKEFVESFEEYLDFMKLKHTDNFHKFLLDDCNDLLAVAAQKKQKKAIEILIGCYAIGAGKQDLNADYTEFMLKLVNNGFYIGHNDDDEKQIKDDNWIEADVLKQFLNSCVTSSVDEKNDRTIQLDYTFLVDPHIRAITLKNLKDKNGLLLFNNSMLPLELILNNEKLKHLITHPLIALYVNLKSYKYRKIYSLNLYMFLLLYVLPFLLVFISFDYFEKECVVIEEDQLLNFKETLPSGFSATAFQYFAKIYLTLSTMYLTLRELIQLLWLSDSKIGYFKKKSNILEVLLICSSWWLLVVAFGRADNDQSYRIPAAFIILLATVEILSILPTSSLSTYMFMLKTVSITFVKFFTIFIVIIIAFTFSFYAIFRPIENFNSNQTILCEKDLHKNFEHAFDSFLKTTLMFAGDFGIEPYSLDTVWTKVLFMGFVITAFILLNLINGLAISDIQKLKEDAEFLNIKQGIRTNVECESVLCNLYWKLSGGAHKSVEFLMYHIGESETGERGWRRKAKNVLIYIVQRFPYLHKMDNLMVDYKLRTVDYGKNQESVPILTEMDGDIISFKFGNEDFEKLYAIIKDRDSKANEPDDSINLLQIEIAELKESMQKEIKDLNENLSQLILNCLQRSSPVPPSISPPPNEARDSRDSTPPPDDENPHRGASIPQVGGNRVSFYLE